MADQQIVEIPGVGPIAFPADMNEDALRAAVQDVHRQGQEAASRTAAGFGEGVPWKKLAAVTGAPAAAAGLGTTMMAAPATLAASAGRLISHPAVGATAGAISGYKQHGWIGVPPGALEGAIYGKLGGGLLARGLGALRTATAPAEAAMARPAGDALTTLGRNLVLSPVDAARKAQLMEVAAQEAKQAGTVAAGRQTRGSMSLIEQLFGQ